MKSKEELAEEYRKQFAADGSHMGRCSHMSFIAGYEAAQIYFKFMHVKSKYIQAVEDAIDFIQHNVDGVAEDQNESEVDPFMVDGLAEFNEELQTLQVNIPKDTVLEEGIIIKDVTYPFNPKEYETETNPNCNGCMFYTNDGFCKVPNSELTRNCNLKSIIYKSLNPW